MKKLYSSVKLRLFVVIFNLQKLGDIPDSLSTKGRSQVKATDATIDIRGPAQKNFSAFEGFRFHSV